MGDFELILNRLNLSPVNTVLLIVALYFLKNGFRRLEKVEDRVAKHTVRHAVVAAILKIDEIEYDEDGGA